MQTRKKILMLTGVALLVPVLLLAQAAEKHLRHGGGGRLIRHIVKQLDLTPDQISQVKTIFANHKTELQTELKALQAKKTQQFDAIHADTLDEAAVRTAATATGQAEADLAVTRARIFGEVRQVLTPEQQAKLKEMLAKAHSFGDRIFSRIQSHLEDPLAGV
ncbi:MAG TPA: Spy/CpxP family protein refolding chaperone [Thermoanaerobaculia bacterium]|jgi:protein CpxP|nr:Spy/CpxP family protein refolding chaperone [Thermoanaerobaculia bacterium]